MIKAGAIFCYNFLVLWAAAVNVFSDTNLLFYQNSFWFFLIMLFMPEFACIFSKGFRQWIKNGIEDSDGTFNKSDFKEMWGHYSALWCLRMFILGSLVEIYFQVEVKQLYMILWFAGMASIELAIMVLKLVKINELKK
jgi:hypothetical protein